MKVKLINGAQAPKRAHKTDAGYDLFLNTDITIPSGSVAIINTGVCVEIPHGYAGLLAMRSSICKTGLIIQQPLIDEGYTGELHAIIGNPTRDTFSAKKGDRLYSLYVFPIYNGEIEIVNELDDSERGTDWSGSTGK